MNNRWSDAARAASIAVRQGHKLLAGRPVQKRGRTAPKPMVRAGGSATIDARIAKRINTGIPQPYIYYDSDYPYGPGQEGRVQGSQGILRYDPKNPVNAEELGYNMGKYKGKWKKSIPPVSERYKDDWMSIPRRKAKEAEQARKRYLKTGSTGSRAVIGGKIYIKIGNKMVPYRDSAVGGMRKVYYQK
jgi:hypothetical protein